MTSRIVPMAAPTASWLPRKVFRNMVMAGTDVGAWSGPAMAKMRSKIFSAMCPRITMALTVMGISMGSSTCRYIWRRLAPST